MVREIDTRAIDALIALVLTVAALGTLIARGGTATGFRPDDLLGTVLVLMQTVPLVLRRVAPLGVLAVVSGAVVTHSALGYQMVQAGTFGSLIALYGAASLTDNRRSLLAAAIAAAALGAFFVTNRGRWEWFQVTSTVATWAVVWARERSSAFAASRLKRSAHAPPGSSANKRHAPARPSPTSARGWRESCMTLLDMRSTWS